jgi:hypothetical protein
MCVGANIIVDLRQPPREKEDPMLLDQTIEKLTAMKLLGMAAALQQWKQGGMKEVEPGDLIGLLADAECTPRENRRLTRGLQEAHFPWTSPSRRSTTTTLGSSRRRCFRNWSPPVGSPPTRK